MRNRERTHAARGFPLIPIAMGLLAACTADPRADDQLPNDVDVAAGAAVSGEDAPDVSAAAVSFRPAAIDPIVARFVRDVPDSAFVRRGACPFECCMYREWKALQPIVLRTQPRDSALAGFTLAAQELFQADSGNVYVTSAQLVAVNDSVGDAHYWSFSPGDTLVVLDYTGEGHYHVWHDGRVQDTEGFWARGRLPVVADTIGSWKTEWWIHATRADGRSGWFIADRSGMFANADACGA